MVSTSTRCSTRFASAVSATLTKPRLPLPKRRRRDPNAPRLRNKVDAILPAANSDFERAKFAAVATDGDT